jgi:hypothetical protein
VRVVVAGQGVVLASGVSLSYRTPTVSGVSPTLLNTQGGDTVSVHLPAVLVCLLRAANPTLFRVVVLAEVLIDSCVSFSVGRCLSRALSSAFREPVSL